MKVLASERPYEGSAGAWLIIHVQGQFLVARRSKECVQDIGKWNWIGGGVDEGERPIQSAIREFQEEAGIDLSQYLNRIVNLVNIGNPISGGVCHFFVLDVASLPGELELNNESNASRWMTLKELFENVHSLNWPTAASLGPLAQYFGIIP